jgi:uncharacterized protein (DUF952 family)
MIYHLTMPEIYEPMKGADEYKIPTMEWEGFIHCLKREQLLRVANDNYREAKKIILLCIDETKLAPKVVEEDLYGMGEAFVHVYGPVNREAIVRVVEWAPGKEGYALPEGL